MMRFRVRDSQTRQNFGTVEVIPTGSGDSTLVDLRRTILDRFFPAPEHDITEADIVLSLNNKDPLKGSPETSLTAIGLRSGDIVWIISPTPAPTQQDPPAAIAPHTSSVKDSSRCDYGDTSSSRREPNSPRAPESGPSAGDPLPMEVENCTQQPLLQFPGHFKRVLASNLDTEYAKTPCGILILLVHAVMLETGFTFVSPAHEKQKDAFSTQPEECDASLKIYKKNMQNNRQYFVPNSCAATMGVTVLTYALPHSIAAGKQSTQRDPDSIRRSIKALAPGPKGEEDINDTEESSDAPKISIHCSRIGGTGMVILGNLNNKASDNAKAQHTQKVLLNALDYFHKTDSSSNTSLDMQMDSGFFHLTVDSIDMMFSMASARGLWNELKDHLALPLLRAACEASGLPSPAHLLSLPGEIKWRILLLLDPFDLSALGQVSSEWRHQASADGLWKPHFEKEFPSPPQWVLDRIRHQATGYRWAFVTCWMERSRRRKEAEEQRARRRRHLPSVPLHQPPPPFYPAPPPPGFPGIIGGEQDRLPFLGGSGTGGRSMFGGSYPRMGGGGRLRGDFLP